MGLIEQFIWIIEAINVAMAVALVAAVVPLRLLGIALPEAVRIRF